MAGFLTPWRSAPRPLRRLIGAIDILVAAAVLVWMIAAHGAVPWMALVVWVAVSALAALFVWVDIADARERELLGD